MAELIRYQELVPGLRHFDCTRQRALISTTTCSARYADAQRNRDDERLDLCRRCPVGAMHAALQTAEAPASDCTVVHEELVNADHNKRCVRCGRVSGRVIGKTLCPSCWNRQREWQRGSNAKGTAPTTFRPLKPRTVGVKLPDGRHGYVNVSDCQNDAEPLARLQRQRPGIRFHGRPPGRTHWNPHRQSFEYRDGDGRTLLQVEEDGGLIEHIAVAELRPDETPAPVRAPTSALFATVAAIWLRLTARDELSPEWRPTEFVCSACHSSALLVRCRGGQVAVECRACGDSATE